MDYFYRVANQRSSVSTEINETGEFISRNFRSEPLSHLIVEKFN